MAIQSKEELVKTVVAETTERNEVKACEAMW